MDPKSEANGGPKCNCFRFKEINRVVGKLTYITITIPDISYAVGVVSEILQDPHIDQWNNVTHILIYVKKVPRQDVV